MLLPVEIGRHNGRLLPRTREQKGGQSQPPMRYLPHGLHLLEKLDTGTERLQSTAVETRNRERLHPPSGHEPADTGRT